MNSHTDPYDGYRSGFAVIAGAPNVGKSTLLNAMIGEKISITSSKPQTTRNRIMGIAHGPDFQIVFIDTPGVHKSDKVFNRRIVDVAFSAMDDVDLMLVVVDASRPDPAAESLILSKLRRKKRASAILALNKVDLVEKSALLHQIDHWSKAFSFAEIVPVSAKEGIQVPELIEAMARRLPAGPPYFPEDAITDLPERFIVAEMVREQIFELTGQEIPYSTAVTVESFSEDENGRLVRIHAVIHVERDSQKGILIGKKGNMLRAIGEAARKQIEGLLGTRVFLKLFVRIEKNWSRNTKAMRKLGY